MSGGRFEEAEGLPLSAIGELKNYKITPEFLRTFGFRP